MPKNYLHNAFTVLELIVSILVVVILVAIALPSIGRAREQAKILEASVHTRQLAQSVTSYSVDFRNYPPSPPPGYRPLYFDFPISSGWSNLLLTHNYIGRLPISSFARRQTLVNYKMTCTFITQPDYWAWSSHYFNPLHLRTPSRLDQVKFPSRKIALHDSAAVQAWNAGLYRGSRVIAAFVDGHSVATDEVRAGAPLGEHFYGYYELELGTQHIDDDDRAGQHTWNGVHGWDVEGG